MSALIELHLEKILQTRTYTVVILKAPEKKFSIYMEPHIGQMLQSFFSHEKPLRPQTFEFIDQALLGLNTQVLRVVITHLKETTFYSNILYYQKKSDMDHLVEVDARPSDSLMLALRHKAPIYCTPSVLKETIEYVESPS